MSLSPELQRAADAVHDAMNWPRRYDFTTVEGLKAIVDDKYGRGWRKKELVEAVEQLEKVLNNLPVGVTTAVDDLRNYWANSPSVLSDYRFDTLRNIRHYIHDTQGKGTDGSNEVRENLRKELLKLDNLDADLFSELAQQAVRLTKTYKLFGLTSKDGFTQFVEHWENMGEFQEPEKDAIMRKIKAALTNQPKKVEMERPKMNLGAALENSFRSILEGDETKNLIKSVVTEVATGMVPVPYEIKFNESVTRVDLAHAKLKTALTRLQAVKNLMLTGPAGCGKTFLASQIADGLQLPFATISCSADMSSSALLGWLLPVNSNKFEYVESDFIRLFENGGVFLLDEMDAADPSILLVINQALANGRLSLPQRRGNTEVVRHKDFICIAACNTFGRGANIMYAGRERIDESTLDRFRLGLIEMDYDADLENRLVNPELLMWAREVRKAIDENEMKRILSTRFLLDATKLLEAGATLNEVKDIYFTGWRPEEREAVDNSSPW